MVQRKQSESLYKMSVKAVILLLKQKTTQFNDLLPQVFLSEWNTMFSVLPVTVVYDVINNHFARKLSTSDYFKILHIIAPGDIMVLNIEPDITTEVEFLMLTDLLKDKYHLRKLCLSSYYIPPNAILCELCGQIAQNKALVHLEVPNIATDYLLQLLRKMCPNVQYLSVSYSQHVTDRGFLEFLFGPEVNGCSDSSSVVRQHSLRMVNLKRTLISTTTVIQLIVSGPNLVAVKHDNILEALVRLHDISSVICNNLVEIYGREIPYLSEEQVFKTIGVKCPYLKKLSLSLEEHQRSIDVVHVKNLQNIEDLIIHNLMCNTAILSDFLSFSLKLTTLHLSFLFEQPTIIVEDILRSCPCLRKLLLHNVDLTIGSSNLTGNAGFISNLQDVSLCSGSFTGMSLLNGVIKFFLIHCTNLRFADFAYCSDLTDDDIYEVKSTTALLELEKIKFHGALQLTNGSLWSLIHHCPKLRGLGMHCLCNQRLLDLESMKMEIRKMNLDIELVTYCFHTW